jgi:hypothetical protein
VQLGAETGPRSATASATSVTTKKRPEPPCKPGSVPPEDRRWRTFLSGARCRVPLASRTRTLGRATLHLASPRGCVPICSCTRWGLPCRTGHPVRGALLPHRFTLATRVSPRRSAVCSLWHFPAGRPDRSLTGTLPCGARTFLGGPSPAGRRVRPGGSGNERFNTPRGSGQRAIRPRRHSAPIRTGGRPRSRPAARVQGGEGACGRDFQDPDPGPDLHRDRDRDRDPDPDRDPDRDLDPDPDPDPIASSSSAPRASGTGPRPRTSSKPAPAPCRFAARARRRAGAPSPSAPRGAAP